MRTRRSHTIEEKVDEVDKFEENGENLSKLLDR